ncbi:MAG: cell division protein ZapB [Candidatus Mucispirillum faecigallinarum]|uniref:Cell division protein ZapB n=1 Tax=Candidatus Mucispirillum faecigallinarum TaxID=2838699 RepID=A0A9D2GW02_9BACT|nr:cell division protein ZapB [Mucispirillum sp.]MDY5051918.1 cell division protein ZapB [Candidatus Mucispirillum faecigallinarum]HIZ90271.1 cell division protein ZapB [Candidatus Mucispirillum faecigallinarum]
MMIQDKLLILEEKLDKLLEDYNSIKQERDLLLEKNNNLLLHIGNIETENSLLKQNKEAVKKRIETMLMKLES